jgi:hypothetical protein
MASESTHHRTGAVMLLLKAVRGASYPRRYRKVESRAQQHYCFMGSEVVHEVLANGQTQGNDFWGQIVVINSGR